MKTTSPRKRFGFIFLVAATVSFVSLTQWLLAAPADDIAMAVASGGSADVKKASAPAFIDAFSSVLVQVDAGQSAAYVAAAQKLRPDLTKEITAAATDVDAPNDDATSDPDRHRVSRHRRKCTICYDGRTCMLPCDKAREFLMKHPDATRGPCTPTPTPTPSPTPHRR